MARFSRILLLLAGGLAQSIACGQIDYESQRQAMIEELRDESRLSRGIWCAAHQRTYASCPRTGAAARVRAR
jgi:hypothetical protein